MVAFNRLIRQLNLSRAPFLSDLVAFIPDCQLVKAGERQAQKETDSAFQNRESIQEGPVDLLLRTLDNRGIRNTPVSRNGLPGPYRTHFIRSLVADGEYEVQVRGPGFGELVPTLAMQTGGR